MYSCCAPHPSCADKGSSFDSIYPKRNALIPPAPALTKQIKSSPLSLSLIYN